MYLKQKVGEEVHNEWIIKFHYCTIDMIRSSHNITHQLDPSESLPSSKHVIPAS